MSAEIARQYENSSMYINLSLRGANPGFHWAIFVPTNTPSGYIWHAVNRTGGWELEAKESKDVPTSLDLCLSLKFGTVNSSNWNLVQDTLNANPADGQPSSNTNEQFTCRVWVKDALYALQNAGIIHLVKPIDVIETQAIEYGEGHRRAIELGTSSVLVINTTCYSTAYRGES